MIQAAHYLKQIGMYTCIQSPLILNWAIPFNSCNPPIEEQIKKNAPWD